MKHLTTKLYFIFFSYLIIVGAVLGFCEHLLVGKGYPGLRILVNTTILFLSLTILAPIIWKVIIKRILVLSIAMKEVTKGNYDIQLDNYGSDQLSQLTLDFNDMTKQLQRNELVNKEFIRNFSHELKTPISSIKGFASLINENQLSVDEIKQYTQIIVEESDRLLNTSRQILILSKLDATKHILLEDRFNLDSQIRKVILLLQPQWQAKNLELDVDLANVLVLANEEMMYFIWLNLISNAIKYNRQDGKLIIKLYVLDYIYFEVSDTGIGINCEYESQIFDLFYTADRSRSGKSSGLGLPIAKTIVDKLNGSISYQSEIDRGTTFVVKLNKSFLSK